MMIRVCEQQETMRLSRVPVSSLDRHASGLRLRWPPWRLTFDVALDVAFQQVETVRGSHLGTSDVALVFIPLPVRGRTFRTTMKVLFRSSIQGLSTRSTRLLTLVSSSQRVSLPGRWLAVTRGRIFTSWMTSIDFFEQTTLESQQLRI